MGKKRIKKKITHPKAYAEYQREIKALDRENAVFYGGVFFFMFVFVAIALFCIATGRIIE